MNTIPTSRKRKRSGCALCRRRAIRCDERAGDNGCANCEKLGVTCPTDEVSGTQRGLPSNPELTAAGLKRRRAVQSCETCRKTKVRCSAERPACLRCVQKGLLCEYASPLPSQVSTGSQQASGATQHASSNAPPLPSWLFSDELPDNAHIRVLAAEYFSAIHPIRSFGFLHKPSFMRQIEETTDELHSPLVLVVCALGAMMYAMRRASATDKSELRSYRTAGQMWAKKAFSHLMLEIGSISVHGLMTLVLLHDHSIRIGQYSTAFMLTGVMTRMAQALQVNLEYSADLMCDAEPVTLDVTSRESRRRLLWACFVTDASIGSGVDQLTLLHERDIRIQLPYEERSFLLGKPRVTELLNGGVLEFLPPHMIPPSTADHMGIAAYYIRLIAIRKRILRYVKHLSSAAMPWEPASEFRVLEDQCHSWLSCLPVSMRYNVENLYVHQETGELGALCLLHGTYHATMIDLYRIFTPELYRLRFLFDFQDHQHFAVDHQQMALQHAQDIATIVEDTISRSGPTIVADFWWPSITFESSRHMVFHVTRRTAVQEADAIPRLLRSNVSTLRIMQACCAMAEPLLLAAERMLLKMNEASLTTELGPEDPTEDNEASQEDVAVGTPTQSAPDYVLHPLSIYRMARKAVQEKHAPEKTTSPTSTLRSPPSVVLSGAGTPAQQELQTMPSDSLPPDTVGISSRPVGDELQLLYPSEMTSLWEPANTIVDGSYGYEIPNWLSDFGYDNNWLDSGFVNPGN